MIGTRHSKRSMLKLSLILITTCCITAFSTPAPAYAGTMQWTTIDTPSSAHNVIVSPSEVNAIAIGPDGITAYAIDIPHNKVYKSMNSGIHWDDITGYLSSAGAALPAWDIAIAPDNPNFVALVTSSAGLPRNVFISTNGGSTWQDTNYPATSNIGAIAISMNYGGYDIVAGSRTGAGGGAIHIFKTSGYSGWADQGFTGDVLAARFSPAYASDSSIIIVSADATGSYVNLGIRDTVANTTNWGTWGPVEITTAGPGTSPGANQIITADIELPFDFSGQTASLRRIFISTNDAGASGNAGVYRIDDTLIYRLIPTSGIKMVASIAYYGSYNAGELLVGEVKANASSAAVDIWHCSNPGAICPQATCLVWQKAVKPPTGGGNSGYANAQVIWSPDGGRAYCGTSSANLDMAGWPNGYLTTQGRDESAFSITLDNGKTWNQLSLIDTEVSFLSDVVASANSDTVYLASVNTHGGFNGFDSLWRSTSYPPGRTWERVLCLLTASDDTILRMSPAQANQSTFLAARSTSDLYQSQDRGQTWNKVLPGVNITDFVVTEIDGIPHMYVLENNYVRKGEYKNQIWKWGLKINTTLSSGHTITATPAGLILVGDAGQGMIAYSEDSGAQFIQLSPIPVPGNVHAIVDTRIGNYIVIYAASDGAASEVYSWVVDISPRWTSMASPNQGFYGLVQAGTLYGAWSTGAGSGADRTLNPERLGPPTIEWGSLTSGLSTGVVFTREPVSIKLSGSVDLWAIDNRPYTATSGHLWGYCDCLTGAPPVPPQQSQEFLFQAPVSASPAMNALIPTDPDTGKIATIEFKWRHPTTANGYDLWISKDEEFSQPVMQESIIPDNPSAPEWTLPPDDSPLEAGETYYWKVRVNRDATYVRGNGQWSEVMSFSLADGTASEPTHTSPGLLTPENNATNVAVSPSFSWTPLPEATEYEFILASDKSLEQVLISKDISNTSYDYNDKLEPGTTYYWQVRAIKPFLSQPSPVNSFTVAVEVKKESITTTTNLPTWLWIAIPLLIIITILITILVTKKKYKRAPKS